MIEPASRPPEKKSPDLGQGGQTNDIQSWYIIPKSYWSTQARQVSSKKEEQSDMK